MSSYDTTTAKGRILREFQGDFMGVNEPLRRYFRLWLDGSYLGEDHYRKNVDYITKNAHNKKAIRSIVKGILPDYLERLTDVLIYDAYDLCEENA